MNDLYHLTIAVSGRCTLARDERERRAALRLLARVAGPWLALFCLVDEHLHALLRALRAREIARDIRTALLRSRPGIALDAPHLKPVNGLDHLENTVGYLLRQPLHHGLPGHPAAWSGSSFADLVGARRLPGYSARILTEELPRLRVRDVCGLVGLGPEPFVPVDDAALRALGPRALVELASGALCVDPELAGRTAPVSQARALAAGMGRRVGLAMVELATALGISRQAVHHLARRPVDPRHELAVRVRAAYLARCQAAPYPVWLLASGKPVKTSKQRARA